MRNEAEGHGRSANQQQQPALRRHQRRNAVDALAEPPRRVDPVCDRPENHIHHLCIKFTYKEIILPLRESRSNYGTRNASSRPARCGGTSTVTSTPFSVCASLCTTPASCTAESTSPSAYGISNAISTSISRSDWAIASFKSSSPLPSVAEVRTTAR